MLFQSEKSHSTVFSIVCTALFCFHALPLFAVDNNSQKIQLQAFTKEYTASEILPLHLREKLKGEHYVVDGKVKNIAGINSFKITSDYGTLEVDGNYLLLKRITEFRVLAELAEITRGEAFLDSQVDAAKASVGTVTEAVTHPVKTVKALPGGVLRIFTGAYEDAENAVSAVTGQTDIVGELGDSIGTSSSIRSIAKSYGVDPYSRNPLLQKEMDRLALFMAAGKKAEEYTKKLLEEDPTATPNDSNSIIWAMSLTKLTERNKKILKDMGIEEKSFSPLLSNNNYIPSEVTRMVDAFSSLQKVKNIRKLVEVVSQAKTQSEAIFYLRALDMLVLLHEKKGGIDDIALLNLVPAAIMKNKKIIIVSPVDYAILYDEEYKIIDAFIEQSNVLSINRIELWIEGLIPVEVNKELTAKGVIAVAEVFTTYQ